MQKNIYLCFFYKKGFQLKFFSVLKIKDLFSEISPFHAGYTADFLDKSIFFLSMVLDPVYNSPSEDLK